MKKYFKFYLLNFLAYPFCGMVVFWLSLPFAEVFGNYPDPLEVFGYFVIGTLAAVFLTAVLIAWWRGLHAGLALLVNIFFACIWLNVLEALL